MRNCVDNCAMKLCKRFMKGHRQVRGISELHDELKTRVNLVLTSTGIKGFDSLTWEMKLSQFKLVEWIGCKLILIDNFYSVNKAIAQGTAVEKKSNLPAYHSLKSRISRTFAEMQERFWYIRHLGEKT